MIDNAEGEELSRFEGFRRSLRGIRRKLLGPKHCEPCEPTNEDIRIDVENKYPDQIEMMISRPKTVLNVLDSLRNNSASLNEMMCVVAIYFEKVKETRYFDDSLYHIFMKINGNISTPLSDSNVSMFKYMMDKLDDAIPVVIDNGYARWVSGKLSMVLNNATMSELCYPVLKNLIGRDALTYRDQYRKLGEIGSESTKYKLAELMVSRGGSITEIFLLDTIISELGCSSNHTPITNEKKLLFNSIFLAIDSYMPTADEYRYGDRIRRQIALLAESNPGVNRILDNYPNLKNTKYSPEVTRPEGGGDIEDPLNEVIHRMDHEKRMKAQELFSRLELDEIKVFEKIFKPRNADDSEYMLSEKYDEKQIMELLSPDVVIDLIETMADHPEKYISQLAILLTIVPIFRINPEILVKLKPVMSKYEVKVRPSNEGWYLCSDAEKRLCDAMINQMVVLVENKLMVKLVGKVSALCLDTFTTSSGHVFLKGCWYTPVDATTNERIRHMNSMGTPRMDDCSGEWAFMRPVDGVYGKTASEIIDHAKIVADRLSERLPVMINGQSRERLMSMLSEDQ